MIIFLCGDSHGHLKKLYDKVKELEESLSVTCDLILHTGSFGVWPDPNRLDRVTRRNKNKIDFYKYYLFNEYIPRPTYFVSGKHEDHAWIKMMIGRGNFEIIPNLFWLVPGKKYVYEVNGQKISILGLGKVFSPKTYNSRFTKKSKSHYTKSEVELACSQGRIDIFISHQPADGVCLGGKNSDALGINNICFATRPKLMVHGSFNISSDYSNPRTGTPTKALAFEEIKVLEWKNNELVYL